MTLPVAPSPSVEYVPTIFQRISSGSIKIPSFQRELVWSDKNVIDLLESIYRGYPVGSILLWNSEAGRFKIEKDSDTPFPKVDFDGETQWVIDGMQRLSSLYGVFNWSDDWQGSLGQFNVYFDLSTEKFYNFANRKNYDLDRSIPLSHIFNTRKMLSSHQKFLSENDEDLVERSLKLQSIFQNYLIPVVTLKGYPVEEIVQVFERINSTGVKLNISQFLRAITWDSDFDLDFEIRRSLEIHNIDGFGLRHDTFTKSVSILSGNGISPEAVAAIRDLDKEELRTKISKAGEIYSQVIDQLQSNFKISNVRFVPYEGQLLLLFKLLSSKADEKVVEAAKTWFWRTSFSESLRGKPDDHIQKHLDNLDIALEGNVNQIDTQFTLVPNVLQERRFNFGSALTSSISAMFAVNNAHDLITGQPIDPQDYMDGNNSSWFHPIIDLTDTKYINQRKVISSRLLANMILIHPRVFRNLTKHARISDEIIRLYRGSSENKVLQSQFLDSHAISLLENGDIQSFIKYRADLMTEFADKLANFERPPSR